MLLWNFGFTCDLLLTDAEEWIKEISLEVKEGRSFDI